MMDPSQAPLLGIVGPCAAGKSTLANLLTEAGVHARPIAQEHSYVQDMWSRLTHPDVLVYLQVSYPVTLQRCQLSWTVEEYQEQIRRLQHAHTHADLTIDTDPLTPSQVLTTALAFLRQSS